MLFDYLIYLTDDGTTPTTFSVPPPPTSTTLSISPIVPTPAAQPIAAISNSKPNHTPVIVGVIAAVVVLALLFLLSFFWWRRRQRHRMLDTAPFKAAEPFNVSTPSATTRRSPVMSRRYPEAAASRPLPVRTESSFSSGSAASPEPMQHTETLSSDYYPAHAEQPNPSTYVEQFDVERGCHRG